MKLRLQNYLNNQNHIQNTSDFQVNYDSPSPPAAERYFLANNDATNLWEIILVSVSSYLAVIVTLSGKLWEETFIQSSKTFSEVGSV